MLRYDYQYDVSAIVVLLTIIAMYHLRKSYQTKSMKILMSIIICDFVTAVLDIISIWAISYPGIFPLWLSYVSSLGYLLGFNMMSILFFLYIDTKTKIPQIKIPVRIASNVAAIYYIIAIVLSPVAHGVAYFDENMEYQHGPLMMSLYISSYIFFLFDFGMFFKARKKFNKYQSMASIAFVLTTTISVFVQSMFERLLVGQLSIAAILYFIYIAFENPAHYSYKDTQCFNDNAFRERLSELNKSGEAYELVAVSIADFDYVSRASGSEMMIYFSRKTAETIYRKYKSNCFALSDSLFVVVTKNVDKAKEIERNLYSMVASPVEVKDSVYRMNAETITISVSRGELDEFYAKEIIDYKLANPDTTLTTREMTDKIERDTAHKQNLIHAIKNAIENDKFEMYYQPIRDVATGEYESAEALIRLFDDELGFINPEELINTAEDNGLILEVGKRVLENVCKFIKDGGIQKLGVKFIEINFSPIQFVDPDLAGKVAGTLERYGIDPHMINIEITESNALQDEKVLVDSIKILSEMGVHFSIDDYGSGFASTDWLFKLPVSIVKIDKFILWNAMKNENARIVLVNTMKLLKDLGKKIVVEGVENEEMVRLLVENGCDYMQGYLYSKPIPSDVFLEFIKMNNVTTKLQKTI